MYSFGREEKQQMLEEIRYYFKEEHDIEFGILGTEDIFDFFLEELGDRIYNMGLDDAKKFYKKYENDMDSDYYALYKDIR